jgi:2-isopropylmalate synthase
MPFLIPVRLDDCEFSHDALFEFQRVDLFPSWEDGVRSIRKALDWSAIGDASVTKTSVRDEIASIGVTIDENDPRLKALEDEVIRRKALGFAYEHARASFELLVRRAFDLVPEFFLVTRFDVTVERRMRADGKVVVISMGVLKIVMDDEEMISAAEGDDPVVALNNALRKGMGKYQPYIDEMALANYRIETFDLEGRGVVRVVVESSDRSSVVWKTVGISPNMIEASFLALSDAIIYHFVKAGAG